MEDAIREVDRVRHQPPATKTEVNRLPCSTDSKFAVALSGGGHRATLFGLGALMAIVDTCANSRTRQIASVSGGSIANLVVAHACEFHRTDTAEFSPIAKKLFGTVVRGVLTKTFLFPLLAVVLGPIVLFVVAAIAGRLPGPSVTIPAILLWLVLILLRGLPIELRFKMRYFWCKKGSLRLESIGASPEDAQPTRTDWDNLTEHVACCTDLKSARPVYFSTFHGGKGFSRLNIRNLPGHDTRFDYEIRDAGRLSVPAILRASAGFPGIPPRRLRLIGDSWTSSLYPVRRQGSVVFLSDGGVWNNLGTQAVVEDNFYHGEVGTPPMVVLCLDASADVSESSGWNFSIPGGAEIQDLWRSAMISNANTVAPRRENFLHAFAKSVEEGHFFGPQPIVVSLSESPAHVAFMLNRWLFLRVLKSRGTMDDLEVNGEYWRQLWNGEVEVMDNSRLQQALGAISGRRSVWYRVVELLSSPLYKELCEIADVVPVGLSRFPIHAPLPFDHHAHVSNPLQDFQDCLAILVEGTLSSQDKTDKAWQVVKTPTTLGAIEPATAHQLVCRGYANTAIAMYMLGLIDVLPSPREHHPWLFAASSHGPAAG
jgi:hypothetical protein